jgi:hypothetical protein
MTLLGDHAALCIRPQQHAEDPDRVRAAILRLLYSYNARASLTAIFPIVTSDAVNRHHHPRHCIAVGDLFLRELCEAAGRGIVRLGALLRKGKKAEAVLFISSQEAQW